MNRIFKYPLNFTDHIRDGVFECSLMLPAGAKILKAELYNNGTFLWAIVNENNNFQEQRNFIMYGTGRHIHQDLSRLNYLSTIFSGLYVWHIFEVIQ